jgi:hypothetical protein
VVAAAVGAIVIPMLYRYLLRPLTALAGAALLADALGFAQHLPMVLGLALVGTVAQFVLDRAEGGPKGAAKAKKSGKGGKSGKAT